MDAAEATLVASEETELPSDRVADLVEYIVCGLVDDEDAVSLDVTDSEGSSLIEVSCSEEDAGRVIGRKGRTIKARAARSRRSARSPGPSGSASERRSRSRS